MVISPPGMSGNASGTYWSSFYISCKKCTNKEDEELEKQGKKGFYNTRCPLCKDPAYIGFTGDIDCFYCKGN